MSLRPRPLTDYYVNTSHNTYEEVIDVPLRIVRHRSRYLFENQVRGESNPEAYNRALRAGCRAVEIDCHDGPNGQPIVKHGFTLVTSCLFESVIRRIEPNLFVASP